MCHPGAKRRDLICHYITLPVLVTFAGGLTGAAFGISLVKVFGYRTKEVRKLYLDGNLYTVIIGAY
ncbi:MAG: hypothetical protein LUG93_08370 [Lachnospiraceae bacterium]|nr:hypothetical protein [Lachnospiraceae bacterium]